ncbi:hypothetical protein SAMN02745126_01366 [Enhydrobacter aerosaccus]|uniref:Uncharacterized protein n=1 Tax=Enhydrobacter aerosaccus TaxID=225324 RepID=A0A1T4L6A3_9HYPH|nr:hypothetical protein [Enhydrobacter aerosaccus]SJZ50081.1 hypothetical protein SAMN02745126_01366 [Enhydrobacter aerosaccus]
MRRVPPLLLLAFASACSLPETRWEKPGADEKATANDLADCRRAARQEAFQAWPFFTYGPPYWGFPSWGWGSPWGFPYWGQYDSSRFYTENRLTDFCMRNKGYQLVTIAPPQTRAATPPAAPQTTDK